VGKNISTLRQDAEPVGANSFPNLVGTNQDYRLFDVQSKWYGADLPGNYHLLDLRIYQRLPMSEYYRGVWDGIFRPNDTDIPLPGWRPASDYPVE
jgi:hypothetical protein